MISVLVGTKHYCVYLLYGLFFDWELYSLIFCDGIITVFFELIDDDMSTEWRVPVCQRSAVCRRPERIPLFGMHKRRDLVDLQTISLFTVLYPNACNFLGDAERNDPSKLSPGLFFFSLIKLSADSYSLKSSCLPVRLWDKTSSRAWAGWQKLSHWIG